jgi:AAA-like domain
VSAFPLRYVCANVLLGPRGERAAVYRIGTISYPWLPDAEKWRWLRRLERFVMRAGADLSVYRVNRAYPADRYVAETVGLLNPRGQSREAFAGYLAAHARRLELLASHVPEVYAVVSLREVPVVGFGRTFTQSIDRVRRRVEELAGVGAAAPIARGELESIAVAEERLFAQVRKELPCARARTQEIEWLLRRVELRGVVEPRLDPQWQPDALVVEAEDGHVAYEPLEHDLWRCCNAPVREARSGPPRLLVDAEAGVTYQAMLCLGALADAPEFPGAAAELLHAPVEAVPFPVDAVMHCQWIGNRDALAQVRRRITDVEQIHRDQLAGDVRGPGLLAEEDRLLAREYEAHLQGSARPPMLRGTISYAIGAPDSDELEARVSALRDQLGQLALHRPRGLQEQLYLDHLLRPDGGAVSDYRAQLTTEQVAATMPIGSQHVGAECGLYLGVAGGRPVRFDPTAAARRNRTTTVLVCGGLGGGKTSTAQTIAFGAERRGSQIIDFDPKSDHGLDRVPQLVGRVRVVELSGAEQHRGVLDPLAIGLPELREELACSYYLDLLPGAPPTWEVAIQRAVRDAVRAQERNSLMVIERLRSSTESAAREVGEALHVVSDFGLARLGFSDGSSAMIDTDAPVTTIRTPGLTLPEPGKSRSEWTRSERISVATLTLIAALVMRMVVTDRSRHKVVILDEAWFLLASTIGRVLIAKLVLLSRAHNALVLLVSQLLGHVGDLSKLIGTHLVFRQESEDEARAALAALRLDPEDPDLVERLLSLDDGACLMRDLDGRVAEVQVDYVLPELRDAFNTTPDAAAA